MGELGEFDCRRRRFADSNDLEMPGDLRFGRKCKDRGCVVQIADGQTRGAGGIEPERAGAARRNEQTRPPRRAQRPKGGKSLVGHAVDRQGHHPFVG